MRYYSTLSYYIQDYPIIYRLQESFQKQPLKNIVKIMLDNIYYLLYIYNQDNRKGGERKWKRNGNLRGCTNIRLSTKLGLLEKFNSQKPACIFSRSAPHI